MGPLKRFSWSFLTFVLTLPVASAQIWDPSGNGLLNGAYNFRQVAYQTDANGNTVQAISLYGTITFDGQGHYAILGTRLGSQVGFPQGYSINGTYSIAASGYGFMSQPLGTTSLLYGLVSNGIFVGSTVDGFNDFMVAAPVSAATNATFNGSYSVAYMEFLGPFQSNFDVLTQLNPNGNGVIGPVSMTAYQNTSSTFSRSETNVTYSFNQGVGAIIFPQGLAIGSPQTVYISPDGNFIFGGSPGDFDFYVGVRNAPNGTPPSLGGLYYYGGIDQDNSAVTSGLLSTYYGSFKAAGGVILGHKRSLSDLASTATNFGSQDSYPTDPTTAYLGQSGTRDFVVSADGAIRIGLGHAPVLGIEVGVRAPELSGSGVFLNPTGIVNGASYSMFTSGVARGELLILYGTNLADHLVVAAAPFPLVLDNVQVLMNNRACALYYVSSGQIAAIVPYGTTEGIVQIQVMKNGQASNAVTAFVYQSAPGIFSLTNNGIGLGAVLHPDFSIVTEDHPAHPGEFVQIFLTGLGDVFPTVADGAPGGSPTFNTTTNLPTAKVGGIAAQVFFSGLAPTLSGLYQVNIQIPASAPAGDLLLGIGGVGAFTSQLSIPVAVP